MIGRLVLSHLLKPAFEAPDDIGAGWMVGATFPARLLAS